MTYSVKEMFLTLQGEGAHAGRVAVFCRFSGCNLWSGREQDRAKADCNFCDTDFVGVDGVNGGKFESAQALAEKVKSLWPETNGTGVIPYVVCTGGEPLLQLDDDLISAFHTLGFSIAIETNGTLDVPEGVDWVCVSPKAGNDLRVLKGNELKLVYPQAGLSPDLFEHLEFEHFYLQPMDDQQQLQNINETVSYCQSHPSWKLSLQTHKLIGIP